MIVKGITIFTQKFQLIFPLSYDCRKNKKKVYHN